MMREQTPIDGKLDGSSLSTSEYVET